MLLGHRGTPATDLDTLRELLLRVSRLADDLPEVSELDLSPAIAKAHGVFAIDARIKVAPCPPHDPFLSQATLTCETFAPGQSGNHPRTGDDTSRRLCQDARIAA